MDENECWQYALEQIKIIELTEEALGECEGKLGELVRKRQRGKEAKRQRVVEESWDKGLYLHKQELVQASMF